MEEKIKLKYSNNYIYRMAIEIYTEEQLNKLKEAIAQGVLVVEYADKKVTYRSLTDMLRTKALMEAEINGPSGDCNDGKSYMQFSKGYE